MSNDVGTVTWNRRTGGRLTPDQRRSMVADLLRVHVQNAVGRLRLAAGVEPGRRAHVDPARLRPPTSPLTRAAWQAATEVLPDTLLNHSLRTYLFGRAIGDLEGVEVDTELLYAAALLHDTGLVASVRDAEFTVGSANLALIVADRVGLSTAATETLESAVTMHHSPRVEANAGPVAYLLAAGAGVDVVGLRAWDLPRSVVADAVRAHPRAGFKASFARTWALEAERFPEGRARLLQRYGAFSWAIRLAPFDE